MDVGLTLELGQPTRGSHPYRKPDPFPRSHQLSTAPQPGEACDPHPSMLEYWLGLILSQLLCVYEHSGPVVFRGHCFSQVLLQPLAIKFYPLFYDDTWALSGGSMIQMPHLNWALCSRSFFILRTLTSHYWQNQIQMDSKVERAVSELLKYPWRMSLQMTHQVKAIATKPDESSLTPGSLMVEEELILASCVLTPTCAQGHKHSPHN